MIKNLLSLISCLIILLCIAACNKAAVSNTSSTESIMPNLTTSKIEENVKQNENVFNTENVVRITFYSYYGQGKGSDVPAENMTEIKKWLDSFTIDKKVDDALNGINTHHVEIEYSNGNVIKSGLDLIVVDGTAYYIKGDKQPNCFEEIISKTSFK